MLLVHLRIHLRWHKHIWIAIRIVSMDWLWVYVHWRVVLGFVIWVIGKICRYHHKDHLSIWILWVHLLHIGWHKHWIRIRHLGVLGRYLLGWDGLGLLNGWLRFGFDLEIMMRLFKGKFFLWLFLLCFLYDFNLFGFYWIKCNIILFFFFDRFFLSPSLPLFVPLTIDRWPLTIVSLSLPLFVSLSFSLFVF